MNPLCLARGQQVIDGAVDLLAVRTAAGRAAARHQRHAGQRRDGHVAPQAAEPNEPSSCCCEASHRQPPLDRLLGRRRDHLGAGFFL